MSLRGDIAAWLVTTIKANLPYLEDVEKIASPEEFDRMSQITPSLGVLVVSGENTNQPATFATDLYSFTVQLWFSVTNFDTQNYGDTTYDIYSILDDLHDCLNNEIPTSCQMPLVILRDSIQSMEEGLVQWAVEYSCGAIIGGQ